MKIFQLLIISLFLYSSSIWAQKPDLSIPKQYEIASITIVGVKFFQPGPIISKSGLKIGNKITIPGPDIAQSIDKLWKEGLFSDVQIYASKIEENKIYLSIELKERPRLNNLTVTGIRKNEIENIKDEIKLPRGSQITENVIQNARFTIKKYFTEKGYYNVDIEVTEKADTSSNTNLTNLTFKITTNKKIKIRKITFVGNEKIKSGKLHRSMKDTKQITWYNMFKRSKYIPAKYQDDKKKLLSV